MRVAIVLLLVAACGDNTAPSDPLFTGLSGSRIKLQWYLYQDGAKQLETASYYDTKLHMRCERTMWIDDIARCTPIVDPTVWTDNECTIEVGRSRSVHNPKYFVGFDRVKGELRAARLLKPGEKLAVPPTAFYELRDGVCTRIAEPETLSYFELPAEVDRATLTEVWPERVDDERLSLSLLASAEGLAAPLGFHDNVLDVECRAEVLPDGTAACVPEATAPAHFADPFCEQPVVVAKAAPRALSIADANGCPTYRSAGTEHTSLLYRREGTACVRAFANTGEHAYRAGAPLELAPVERIVEQSADRRLQRIAIATGSFLTLDTRLYDTATRTDCKSYGNGELAVCVPTTSLAAMHLYANDKCSREVLIADVPDVQCEKSAFAIADTISIHAIGNRYDLPLYALDAAMRCTARSSPADTKPFELGPPIPPTTFVAGVVFSER